MGRTSISPHLWEHWWGGCPILPHHIYAFGCMHPKGCIGVLLWRWENLKNILLLPLHFRLGAIPPYFFNHLRPKMEVWSDPHPRPIKGQQLKSYCKKTKYTKTTPRPMYCKALILVNYQKEKNVWCTFGAEMWGLKPFSAHSCSKIVQYDFK